MTKPRDADQQIEFMSLRGEVLDKIRRASLRGVSAELAQSAVMSALEEVYPALEKNR